MGSHLLCVVERGINHGSIPWTCDDGSYDVHDDHDDVHVCDVHRDGRRGGRRRGARARRGGDRGGLKVW